MQSLHPHLFEKPLTFDHSFAYTYYAVTPGKLFYTPKKVRLFGSI